MDSPNKNSSKSALLPQDESKTPHPPDPPKKQTKQNKTKKEKKRQKQKSNGEIER